MQTTTPDASGAQDATLPKVLYIAGYGRSGSTLLDIALAQHADVFGAGELLTMTRHVWPRNEYCGCGERIADCEIWSKIMARWRAARGDDIVQAYTARQDKFEAILSPFHAPLRRRSAAFDAYAEDSRAMFRAIAAESGCGVVVDSSKNPGRALALSQVPGLDVHVVHLVRDGRAVAWSMSKQYDKDLKAGVQIALRSKSPARTAVRWSLINMATESLRLRLGRARFSRLSYEGFTHDPAGAFAALGADLGLDLAPIGAAIAAGEPIKPAHQMAGNRLRMKSEITVSHDSAWADKMPQRQQSAVQRICGWQLRRYGYR